MAVKKDKTIQEAVKGKHHANNIVRSLRFKRCLEIELTRGKVAIIDEVDLEKISGYRWSAHNEHRGNWYARAPIRGTSRIERMHRLIMDAPDGMQVDHKNRDGLDNRRENLRLCTHAQNIYNQIRVNKKSKSGFKGVYIDKRKNLSKRWMAKIGHEWLGRHATKEEAARAYNERAKIIFGEFAVLNVV